MQAVQQNSTLFMHVLFAKVGKSINPDDPEYNEELLFGRTERECCCCSLIKDDASHNLQHPRILVFYVDTCMRPCLFIDTSSIRT